MRIKRLDITGFKSFMERSVFTLRRRGHRHRRPQRLRQVERRRRHPLGDGRAEREEPARPRHGGRHLQRLGDQAAAVDGRGVAHLPRSTTRTRSRRSTRASPRSRSPAASSATASPSTSSTRPRCRLLDITELFLGTGVGTKAYSIIEQGRVGLIVSSKPEDRRASSRRPRASPSTRRAARPPSGRWRPPQAEPAARDGHRQRAGEAARHAQPPGEEGGEVQEAQGARCARSSCTPPRHRYLELHAETEGARRRGWRAWAARSARAWTGCASWRRPSPSAARSWRPRPRRCRRSQARCTRWRAQVQRDDQDLSYWRKDLEETQRPRGRRREARAGRAASRAQAEVAGTHGRARGGAAAASPARGRRTRSRCRWRRRSCAAPTPAADRGRAAAGAGARGAGRRGHPAGQPREQPGEPRPPARGPGGPPREEPRRGGGPARAGARAGRGPRRGRAPRWRRAASSRCELAERKGQEEEALVRTRAGLRGERDPGHRPARGAGRQAQPAATRCEEHPEELRRLRPRRARGDAARRRSSPRAGHLRPGGGRASPPPRASRRRSRRRSASGCSTSSSRAASKGFELVEYLKTASEGRGSLPARAAHRALPPVVRAGPLAARRGRQRLRAR